MTIGEAVLAELVKIVLGQLASPAVKEFKLLWGHKKELKKLENTISTIKNVLEDADRRQAESEAVRGWLARLRVVLYDADDLFDHVSYLVLQEKANAGGKMTGKVCHLASKSKHLFKNYLEVKAIRESLDDIAGDINKFGLITSLARIGQEQPNRVWREQTHSYVQSSDVVGRDQEREDIVKLLLADNCEGKRGVSVVAVIGIGGMGKTTLAQFVYGDERVQQGFDLCMWCCVNYFSNLKVALEAIIRSATGSAAPERLDVEQLQIKLRDVIGGKRFLLVLDDVWDEDAENWDNLRILLDTGKGGSVVLATMRSVEVAESVCAAKPYYHLQGLTDESAWLLFKKIAFGEESEGRNYGDLEQSGREIVIKCGNAPLAIRVIASMLRHKEKEDWFPLVLEELSRAAPNEHGKVMRALKVSYNALSSPVRRCFAYCSLFPKGKNLNKDKMVRLWIAQGFVEDSVAGRSLEDVAEDYLSCLVNRCFIQNCEEGSTFFPKGKNLDKDKLVRLWIPQLFVKDSVAGQSSEDVAEDYYSCSVNRWFIQNCEEGSTFMLHDLMHDLALNVAGSESIMVDKIGPNFGNDTLRHVSLCAFTDLEEQLSSFSQSKRLRTFLLDGTIDLCKLRNADVLFSSIKAVRVLDLSSSHIQKIPDSVGQLVHLRYLDLSWNGLKMLPSSICSLHHLQYLDLSGNDLEMLPSSIGSLYHLQSLNLRLCNNLKQLPMEIGKLISLRHLQIEGCGKLSEMPQGLTDLTSLVTLDRLIVHSSSGGLRYLECLDSLSGSLEIKLPGTVWKDAATDAHKACLSKKHRLQKLWIQWESEVTVDAETVVNALQPRSNLESLFLGTFGGEKMPRWISEIHNLVSLSIDNCGRCVELPSLRHLQFLKVLEISRMSSMEVIEEDDTGSMSDSTNLIFFPSLETLSICGMPNLKSWLKQSPSIQFAFRSVTKVTIWGCPKLTTCMPLFPQVEDLVLFDIQEKLFWQAIGSDGTNRLKKLKSGSIHGLRGLPGAQIRHLSALRKMELGFYVCQPIARHVLGVEYLISLQKLVIFNSKEVYLSWGVVLGLPHLRILKFHYLEKVIDVGSAEVQRQPSSPLQVLIIERTSGEWIEGIPWRSFPSLHSLKLEYITNLEALPQGIQHLTSLQDLQLHRCESVVLLPHWMTSLSSLRSLCIYGCSEELKERCKRPTGEDWPNIQRIPCVTFDFKKI